MIVCFPSKLREYSIWRGMIRRCAVEKAPNYYRYGAKGVKVCKRWLKFENFLADMGLRPAAGYSVDRIERRGNYTPRNCRWATAKEQALNRDSTEVCSRGHKKAGANLYLKPDGRRNCRVCKRESLRQWRARKAA